MNSQPHVCTSPSLPQPLSAGRHGCLCTAADLWKRSLRNLSIRLLHHVRRRICQPRAERPGTADVFGRCISKIYDPTNWYSLSPLLGSSHCTPALTFPRFLPSLQQPGIFRTFSFQDSCWEQLLNISLWKPKASVALQSKPWISMQKVGASPNTLSVLVIAVFRGVAAWSATQTSANQGAGSVSPRRALCCPYYSYSFTLKSESSLCFFLWNSEKDLEVFSLAFQSKRLTAFPCRALKHKA